MKKLIADITIAPNGGSFTGPGTSSIFSDPASDPAGKFELLISRVVGVMTVVAGIWFIFVLFIGAIGWITAGGDKGAVETARKRISNGLTGLVIVTIAIFILSFVGQLLGFEILNIAAFIGRLSQ